MSSRSADSVASQSPVVGGLRRTVRYTLCCFGILALAVTVVSLLLHDDYQRQAREAINGELAAVKSLTGIVTAVSSCRDHEIGFVRQFDDSQARAQQVEAWEAAWSGLESALQPLPNDVRSGAGPPSSDFLQKLGRHQQETTNYRRQFLNLVGRVERGEIQSKSEAIAALDPVNQASARLIGEARRASDEAARSADLAVMGLQSDITRAKMFVLIRGLMPLAVLAFVGIMFSRLVLRRLAVLAKTLRTIAGGDLSARAPVDADDEIGIVARHLNEMADTIQVSQFRLEESRAAALTASQSKSQFLASASHEIRTPMTAILGFADELTRSAVRPEDADLAGTIARNGQHLLHVINDILDLSKIEAGKLAIQRERFGLNEFLREVQRLVQPRIENRDLTVTFESPAALPESIETDPTRLRQILINLIGNAIKFTERGSIRVVTTVENRQESGTFLQFDVIDTGVGIAPEQLAKLFQPFSQLDARSGRQTEGTGLGLVICKRLAEALGGEISVVSEEGRGSTFTIAIPIGALAGIKWIESQPPSSGEIIVTEPTVGGFQRMLILVVEDGLDNQRLIVRMLERAGARVELASNGELALAAVGRREADGAGPFDVILMDMQMPVLDGYEATSRLRAGGYGRPIVALTANAMQHDRERCLEAGCDDYLSKPIHRNELLRIVGRYAPLQVDSVSAAM